VGEGSRDPGVPELKHRPLTRVPISDCGAVPGAAVITHVGMGVERNGDRVAPRIGEGRDGWVENARVRFIPVIINETRTVGLSMFQLLASLMQNRLPKRRDGTNKCGVDAASVNKRL